MKNNELLHILIISVAVVLFSCAGESRNEDSSNATTESTKISNDILVELETPNTKLTNEQLQAFEVRAIQKFQDFTDYVKIISTNDVEKELINHSLNLMHEIFINDSTEMPFKFHLKTNIKIKKIKFSTPLMIDSIGSFNGIMEASLIINGKRAIKKIDIHLVKIEKTFGDNKQYINEVRLGNIY